MNQLGSQRIAFFFLFDFELNRPVVLTKNQLVDSSIEFSINGKKTYRKTPFFAPKDIQLTAKPISQKRYRAAFDLVQKGILGGDSYLLNLTFPTSIQTNLSLAEIFHRSQAKYKLLFDDQFVAFSPEIFVRIHNRRIASFPMKGTIDANIPNAKQLLLNNPKEVAEHATIVDLIRNDLNLVAEKVQVERFQYIDHLKTAQKNLLQVSSKVTGVLPKHYPEIIGDILLKLLPAGSISGAPKRKTIEIIQQAEQQERGYYTGVFGYFDGQNLDSGVLIRFIEQANGQTFYRSGGGITANSDCGQEYQELLDKIYVPIY
ncbi:MAG: aminodeoxychorismate synthase component I [Bacteroidota bacterium]